MCSGCWQTPVRIIHISLGMGGKLEGKEKYKIPRSKRFIAFWCIFSRLCYGLLMLWKREGLKGLVKANLCNFKIIYSWKINCWAYKQKSWWKKLEHAENQNDPWVSFNNKEKSGLVFGVDKHRRNVCLALRYHRIPQLPPKKSKTCTLLDV